MQGWYDKYQYTWSNVWWRVNDGEPENHVGNVGGEGHAWWGRRLAPNRGAVVTCISLVKPLTYDAAVLLAAERCSPAEAPA